MDELAAASMSADMDVDSEYRDDVVLETSPEGARATGEASAQNRRDSNAALKSITDKCHTDH